MTYNPELAERIRRAIGNNPDVSEMSMFGGLAFLVSGNMAVAASGNGGIMVRVDPQYSEKLVQATVAELMVMHGKSMNGWLHIDESHLDNENVLQKWVQMGVDYARTLPPKK